MYTKSRYIFTVALPPQQIVALQINRYCSIDDTSAPQFWVLPVSVDNQQKNAIRVTGDPINQDYQVFSQEKEPNINKEGLEHNTNGMTHYAISTW